MSNTAVSILNPIQGNGETLTTISKLRETYRVAGEIIENLDEYAIGELYGGSEKDLNGLFDNIVEETYSVLYGNSGLVKESDFYYLDKLTKSVEETLRVENLNYFILSCMPSFELNWHHIEWGQLTMRHVRLCIEAARDHGKCLAPETPVLMFDGNIKLAKDIELGDLLMGADSTPRTVLALYNGKDNMYKVSQYRGDDYIVNSRHTLTILKKNNIYNSKRNTCGYYLTIEDIDIEDYLKISEYKRKTMYYGFKVSSEFHKNALPVDPYYIGLWLGDGNRDSTGITSMDPEIQAYLGKIAAQFGLKLYKKRDYKGGKASLFVMSHGIKGKSNDLFKVLKKLDLINNKHIPNKYLTSSSEDRLKVLAGLIDSDGNLHDGCYYIGQINETLALNIKQLADSLGFCTKYYRRTQYFEWMKREDKNYVYYELVISGELHRIPCKIKRKKVFNVEKDNHKAIPKINGYDITTKSPLKVESIGRGDYVGFSVDGDQRFVLGDGTVTHNSYYFSNALPVWNMYRYKGKSEFADNPRLDLMRLERGFIITNEMELAIDLLEIVKNTIEDNADLSKKLFPVKKDNWSKQSIKCKNGARLNLKSYGGSFRGRHPGYIIVDDFLKENVIYSEVQRKKATEYFHSVIMNAIVPKGQVIVVGTPFHASDLYGDLKEKKGWKVFEYPAIFPDGKILWSNRYSFRDLMDKKESQGNLIFSRENLVRPIVSDSSIFPWELVSRSFVGMSETMLVKNRESYPIKFNKIVTGCDFAMSSSVGADYSVFMTWGITENEEMYLMHVYREKGKSYAEQMAVLKTIYSNFRPDCIYAENNQFQRIFIEGMDNSGLPVFPHTTGTNKYDLKFGLPGLSILFEKNKIKFPRGDEYSKNVTDLIISEFTSVTWTDKGLEGVGNHDDCCMAAWISSCAMRHAVTGVGFGFLD